MKLPTLKAGHRFAQPRPISDADAWLLAELARKEKAEGRLLAVFCADAQDARRLQDEIGFFAPELAALMFPDWETLPYDAFSPHQDLISERLATLWRILNRKAKGSGPDEGADVLLIPASTALYKLAPPAFLAAYTFAFEVGQTLDESALKQQLTMAGYNHVGQVLSPGEYAVRGSLIDLYPMGAEWPLRIDLFDDEIDSIRTFDPDTQRTLEPVERIRLLPGREFPMDEAARTLFRQRWRELMEGDPSKSRIYKDMGHGLASAGIEYYLPLFFEETATVFDYLGGPENCTAVLHGELDATFQQFAQDTEQRYRMNMGDAEHPPLAPQHLFLTTEQFFLQAKPLPQLSLKATATEAEAQTEAKRSAKPFALPLPPLAAQRQAEDPLATLKSYLASKGAPRALFLAESEGRRQSLQDFLRASDVSPQNFDSLAEFQASDAPLGMVVGALGQGFVDAEHGIALLTETELFALPASTRRRRKHSQASQVDGLIRDLAELKVGDPVVHSAHGIGRYRGLLHMDTGQVNPDGSPALQEFLHLEYAKEAVLYVPVSQLHLISRYSGMSEEQAPLHRLGSAQWEKAKRKAAEQVRDSAAELLNIYARRAARQGHAFRLSQHDYDAFAADFGYEETPDQKAAIEAVIADMLAPQPMDRLVCGDVGFGKTEVALRAAFVAAMGGKQVALLAPTTLLAEQHHQTLADRFAKWPIRLAELSRFRTSKEINAAIQGLEAGTVDIVVGTHKLLSDKVQFQNLGLLIIDEEHRFGVRHKEAIKAKRAEVDVLTLTATPIPRTMGMALDGIRDLSVIATAPQRRLSIKTFVREESGGTIKEAAQRELKRGGQLYFLHNEVASMEHRLTELQALLPEARIAMAHGQMPERELEAVMRDFVAQRFNVLLCSTIIETGIDVPTANTIIISRADKFGLAQLHQLRGRVGRSHHQAYAYLLAPEHESLGKQAMQRLEAIQQMEDLGSGFYLAMHDLEIRGAGEMLGENQSGNMQEIGFQLYNEMLAQAVKDLKAGREPDLLSPMQAVTEINLHSPALLPDAYCGDVQLRLSFYKKLATAESQKHIDQLQEELIDRFGKLPEQALTLFEVHRLRVLAQPYGVLKVEAAPGIITISFKANAPIEPLSIIHLIQKNKHIRLAGNDKLRIEKNLESASARAQMVRDVLRQLQLAV